MRLAASILVFALLMAMRDEVENVYLRMLIAAAAGLALATVVSESRRARGEKPPPVRVGVHRPVLWIATGLYALSWILPVIKDGWTLDRGLPGWQAFSTALHPLWDWQAVRQEPWSCLYWVACGLTNVFMLAALLRLHLRSRPTARAWLWVAWAAFALNASIIIWDWNDQSLLIGYHLWMLSFAFLAISFGTSSARTVVAEAQIVSG